MNRQHYFWAAVCLSLLLHIAALAVAAQTGRYSRIWLPPLRRPEDTVIVSLQKPPVIHDEMGDRAGTGTASSSSEGPKPLQARQADEDQPQLDRQPTGPGKIGKEPPSNQAPGERGHGGQRGQMAVQIPPEETAPPKPAVTAAAKPNNAKQAKPPPPAMAEAQPKQPEKSAKTLALTVPAPKPPTTAPAVQVAAATPELQTKPTPENQGAQPQAATGDGLAPGRAAAADPAQQSDSESDAFTTVGAAVFHDGSMRVRSGRKIKTVRPELLVPGLLDTIGVSDPTVVLKINIDATGKVTLVNVVHSSGSNDIDQPCVVAVYDWWFEPARDAKGKPVPDVVLFTISFR